MTQTIYTKCRAELLVDDCDFDHLNQFKWYLTNKGYAIAQDYQGMDPETGKRKIRAMTMQREIMQATKGQQVDHIDGNRLNNVRSNLRVCTPSQNSTYKKKSGRKSRSIYKGITYIESTGKWLCRITVDGKRKHVGHFDSEIQAAKEYNAAAIKEHGAYALLNPINEEGPE